MANTFFKLNYSTVAREIGSSIPQVRVLNDENYAHKDFYRNIDFNKKIYTAPIFGPIKLEHFAKNTDYLSHSCGLFEFISNNMLLLLKQFDIFPDYNFFPIKVSKRNQIWDYFVFSIIGNALEHIDLEKTIFYEINYGKEEKPPRRYVTIEEVKHIEEWEKWHSKDSRLRIEKLVYKSTLKNYDMFKGSYFDSGYFVSERLKDSLEKNRITGIMFEECNINFGE